MNIMVDIETLSLRDDAVIHQIGMVAFDTEIRGGSIIYPDITLQKDRHISPETFIWTMRHRTFLDDKMNPNMSISSGFFICIDSLCHQFAFDKSSIKWWSHHNFDFRVLGNAMGIGAPFGHRTMDSYTLFQACGYRMQENTHNGLEDALNQARGVIECNKRLEAI